MAFKKNIIYLKNKQKTSYRKNWIYFTVQYFFYRLQDKIDKKKMMVNLAQELYNCLWIEGQHNLILHIINPKKNANQKWDSATYRKNCRINHSFCKVSAGANLSDNLSKISSASISGGRKSCALNADDQSLPFNIPSYTLVVPFRNLPKSVLLKLKN